MKEEKDDLEASIEGLRTALKTMEANADKYKEENWNLEVSLQDLRTSHTNLQSSHTKLTSEAKALNKQLSSSVASSEALTTHVASLESQIEELKTKHETDLANARKHAASLARDKSDLQQSVDALKAEVAKGAKRFPKFGSPLTPNGGVAPSEAGGNDFLTPGDFRSEGDVFSNPGTVGSRRGGRGYDDGEYDEDLATALGIDDNADASPIKRTTLAGLAPGHPDNEIEVLKERLMLAQRQIGTLKGALLRERNKAKGRRVSADDEEDNLGDEKTAQALPRLPQFRVGGRGRGRGVSLTERFRQVQSRGKAFADNEEEEEVVDDFDDEPVQENNIEASPSPLSHRNSVVSVEGMDPMFANVLKRTPSVNGSPSPLHHSVLTRSSRGRGRGRGAVVSDRPRSLVGAPEDLAAALGVETEEAEVVQPSKTAEMGCQTEALPESVMVSTEMQTEAETKPLTLDTAVQSTPVKKLSPILVSTGTSPAHDRQRTTTLTQQNVFALTPRMFPSQYDEVDSGDETETGMDTETETDTDDYQDARQSLAGVSTPNLSSRFPQSSTSQFGSSVQDFHSVMTMSDVGSDEDEDEDEGEGESEDDDTESIRALPITDKDTLPVPPAEVHQKEYDDKGVDAAIEEPPSPIPPPSIPIITPEVVKPEVREMEIQTDPWSPPPETVPFPAAGPPTPGSPALYRVGSANQQGFTFIPPPPPKTSLPTSPSTGLKQTSPRSKTLRHSIDSIESILDEAGAADTTGNISGATVKGVPRPPIVDKSKPPTMIVPPPPRAPPPPGTMPMPPPTFIPDRRGASEGAPPPRPSSPPPAELIQRATTPTFGTVLSMSHSRRGIGGSMPPPSGSASQGIRTLPSTSSFRSVGLSQTLGVSANGGRKEMSTTSLTSDRSARSSMSSDQHPYVVRAQAQLNSLQPHQQNRNVSGQSATSGDMSGTMATDPAVIHAITQTMIGEFLYKYTRKAIGKGYGEKRHKRFFWVHPYTRTLYWSSADPGSMGVSESSAKSGMFLIFGLSDC